MQSVLNAANASTESLLGRPLIGNGASGAAGTGAAGGDGGILWGNGGNGGSGGGGTAGPPNTGCQQGRRTWRETAPRLRTE
jgi:hypothetical protein